MSSVLLVTWDGGGNAPPLISIAAELAGRGHEVRILGHERQRASIEAADLNFTAYRHALPWSPIVPRDDPAIFATFVDGGAGRDVEEILAARPADVVVVDCLMLGALQAAQATGLPTVVLFHSFYAFFGQGVAHSPLSGIGAAHGRPPQALWDAATEVLVASDRQLDPAAGPIPANVHWTGVAQERPAPRQPDDRRRILLSLSTVWFPGQQESLQTILDALADLPVEGIATIDGSVAARDLRVPANVEAHGFVSHREVMPQVSLVIGHGGHATTMRALAHDLPLLIVPQHPIDQPMIGGVIQAHGAGLMVEAPSSPAQVREAITKLLADDAYARAAATIGARLRASNGAALAGDRIEALVRAQATAEAAG